MGMFATQPPVVAQDLRIVASVLNIASACQELES